MLWKWKSLSPAWLFVTPWTIQSMKFSRPEYWSGLPFPFPGDLPNPGIEPRSPTLYVDSLPTEPPGKPKNTGVGSVFLLSRIFLTQELNQGLLHCRWILYQLSYQGSPWEPSVRDNQHSLALYVICRIILYFVLWGSCCLVTKLHMTLVTPWTVAHQTPLSMGFPSQEYWSTLSFPSLGDLPNPGI